MLEPLKAQGQHPSEDMFLIFLDKLRDLTPREVINQVIIDKLANTNIELIQTKHLLNIYQELSDDFAFERKLSMNEIKKFADNIIPTSKFIFNNYGNLENAKKSNDDPNVFSFFGSQEKVFLKPEDQFKNLYEVMTYLPVDYYILL